MITIPRLLLLFAVFATCGFAIRAQVVYTPEKGSDERKAILEALRRPVERDLKQKIVFAADHFKVQGNWAYVSGSPQTSGGRRPNLKGTAWEDAEDLFDDNFFGLLRKTRGRWSVVTHALGCTDVCYSHWWKTYRAPKRIFPYIE
ncbi:MAG: hypothetical protein LC734_04130 [Acidobacteria bacterium]|nr:hypothetical protein [Acidobacteriota bacterium]